MYIDIPKEYIEYLRNYPLDNNEVTQVDSDVWIKEGPLNIHTDSTAEGLITYGIILLDDLDSVFVKEDEVISLRDNNVYYLDARKPHGILRYWYSKPKGRIAFLAWDMPEDYMLSMFKKEVEEELANKVKKL